MDNSLNCLTNTKLLLDFLWEESTSHELPEDLWSRLEDQFGDNLYQEILFLLTQMQFDPEEARGHWFAIIKHREGMQISLNRDVGMRVAMADYFVNITPKVENPILIEINLLLKKEESALRDELTGLFNRRFFNRTLVQELERGRRFKEQVSLLMIDVDHFKQFNDSYGHPAGDCALAEIADVLSKTSRNIDHLIRYGGEEFCIILPKADRLQALTAAERHRRAVERHAFLGEAGHKLTISLGAATFPVDADNSDDLVEAADKALYRAKKAGRNQAALKFREKRRSPRFPIALDIRLRPQDESGSFIRGRTLNISTFGLLGTTRECLREQHPVEIKLPLTPDKENGLALTGRCVRVDRDPFDASVFNIGVRFDLRNEDETSALNRLIEESAASLH